MSERPSTASGTRTKTPPNDNRRTGINSSPRPKGKDQSGIFCRNITIYGHCRYQDKGCVFSHEHPSQRPQLSSNGPPNAGRGRFNVDSPSFTPSTPPKTVISPKAADAAPFTPKGSTGTATPPVQPQFLDAHSFGAMQSLDAQGYQNLQHGFDSINLGDNSATASINPYEYGNVTNQVNPYAQGQVDMFYQPPQNYLPLNYHLYAPKAPYQPKLQPYQRTIHGFFMSDNLREELQRKGEAILQTLPSMSSTLPQTINEFHSLVPLDMPGQKNSLVFGYPSMIYKAFSNADAKAYALRRVEGFRLSNENDIRIIQRWKKIISANIVTVYNAWTTTKFGDSSIVFVYDFHPLSKTLAEAHFGTSPMFTGSRPVQENILWSYIVQLASALKIIHDNGLAARSIDLTKVLVTSKMRLRLNCCGMLDVIQPEPQHTIHDHQKADLVKLGHMMLTIGCNNQNASAMYSQSIEFIGKQYSPALRDAIFYLSSGHITNIDDFVKSISGYTLQNFNSALHYEDSLESELIGELENGRLVRLLCKFGFINERPEFDHDLRWSETGDRYFLKLFRDYVFHAVDENGLPIIDMSHVLTCLNKLDAGVDEKIMLVSRDNCNCFIVSYKDLKRQIESAFQDINKQASRR